MGVAPLIPDLVERLHALKELHERAAQFAGSVAYIADSQDQLGKETKELKALLSQVCRGGREGDGREGKEVGGRERRWEGGKGGGREGKEVGGRERRWEGGREGKEVGGREREGFLS